MNYFGNNQLNNLGYDDFFEQTRISLGYLEYPVARVSAEYREAYRIIGPESREYFAKVTGRQMYTAQNRRDYPAVGDWVVFSPLPDGQALIRGILSRKTLLERKASGTEDIQIIAANIDTAFIVESVDRDFNLNRYERYLVLVTEAKIEPVCIVNKVDLVAPSELQRKISEVYKRFPGIPVLQTSSVKNDGIIDVRQRITPGKTYCFLGSSGVGKSTLINLLLNSDEIKTRNISLATNRGRHTTTSRDLYFMENGGILIDNPGTREVGLTGSDTGIGSVFDEIGALSIHCKFSDCTHTSEPGCAVLAAINSNTLDHAKYDNYLSLKKESDFNKLTQLEKRTKDRKFGKYVKKVLKELEH